MTTTDPLELLKPLIDSFPANIQAGAQFALEEAFQTVPVGATPEAISAWNQQVYLSTDVLESWWDKAGLTELVVLYSNSSLYDEWINEETKRTYQGMRINSTKASCGINRYTNGV